VKAVFIVNESRVAKILVDPMRRAILELLHEKPMTQTQLANELGLTVASLNYHINLLKSHKLVNIVKRKVGTHGIVQIFFSSSAYLFVYDLKSLPRDIERYFYPIALERIRAVLSVLMLMDKEYDFTKNDQTITLLSSNLSDFIVRASLPYINREVTFGKESIIFEIYIKAIKGLVSKSINKMNQSG
jgi:DNA-binding transcriptional ArsR family regulator